MKRGTTYTQILTVAGVDLSSASEVFVTLKAHGKNPIVFDLEHMSLSGDSKGTTIAIKLSEEQSLSLVDKWYDIDVNWMLSGTRGGTRIKRVTVSPTLYNKVIGGGTDTPDPSQTEPNPVELTSEEARVLNAISPKVTNVTHSGDVTIVTITDISGEHEMEIPDGQQGKQGEAGVSPTVSVTDISGGHRVTITDAEGQHTFDVLNGEDGTDGTDGQDGFSPTASVTQTATGATISITDKTGTTTANIENGTDGQDGTDAYVYIRYSAAEPTSDSDMKTTPDAWIGIYSGDAATAPTAYTAYTWYKIKGETGAAGQVQDVQVNGTSVLQDGVAVIPYGSANRLGVLQVGDGFSASAGVINVDQATADNVKAGTSQKKSISPYQQHRSTFYGLAKAAGDTTQSASSNAVGTYTDAAKSAISTMLNSPIPVTGTTPTITALSGIQYVCGECATLDITLPASGIVDVVFTSGSTPTVLTITPPTGMTVEWANGFDSTALEADTLYELNIKMVGTKCLGVAGAWN